MSNGKLTDQRRRDLIGRARHGHLPIARDIRFELIHFILAVKRRRQYDAALHGQKLDR
jgi:hypothetical protein